MDTRIEAMHECTEEAYNIQVSRTLVKQFVQLAGRVGPAQLTCVCAARTIADMRQLMSLSRRRNIYRTTRHAPFLGALYVFR